MGMSLIEHRPIGVSAHSVNSPYMLEIVTRNSSVDEIANVNFFYDILHVVQNIIRTQNIIHNRGSEI